MSESVSQLQSSPPLDTEAPLPVRQPEIFEGPWADAQDLAVERREPVFVPVRTFADDRGWSIMNLLTGVMSDQGQVNFSMQYPGVVKAWHCHRQQTDFWTCVCGQLKAGIFRESDETAWMTVMGEQRPGVLIIPPGLWHGATVVGSSPAGLMYYVTHSYNPHNPDELRREHDSVEGFPWGPRHG